MSRGLCAPPPAYQHFSARSREFLDGASDGRGRECAESALHVLGSQHAAVLPQNSFQPMQVEVLPSGALGRSPGKIGVVAQPGEESFVHASRACPSPTSVHPGSDVALGPVVDECVAGAAVESGDPAARRQNGDVRNAADVHHRTFTVRQRHRREVKAGGKRCAFAARGDIASAKVGDSGDPGTFGDDAGISDLNGIGVRGRGAHGRWSAHGCRWRESPALGCRMPRSVRAPPRRRAHRRAGRAARRAPHPGVHS